MIFFISYKYKTSIMSTTISFRIAIYMSELLNFYGEIDCRVRPLVMVVRKWAKNQEITSYSPGPWITNFSLSLLVLFYLQQKNILPSLSTLISCASKNY